MMLMRTMNRVVPMVAPESLMSRELARLFDWTTDTVRTQVLGASFAENADGYELSLDLPGVRREGLKVEFADGAVRVDAKRPEEAAGKRQWSERNSNGFTHEVSLPPDADPGRISARLQDGVLTIRCQKSESSKPREISIVHE